ncbi:MAG: hypothetical protein QW815_06400, partial [Nitrososphaerota archaeon]
YPDRSYEIHPLEDYFGPRMLEEDVEAIVVSEDTSKRVEEANRLRLLRGVKPLHTIVVNMVLAEDGLPISTSRIRKGEIDEEGRTIRCKKVNNKAP